MFSILRNIFSSLLGSLKANGEKEPVFLFIILFRDLMSWLSTSITLKN